MSLTGGHLDALLAAGATAEQIVALVKADMAEREKALEIRRSKDAERQRRKRSRGVTRTGRDTPPNERDNLTPPCEEKPEPKGSAKKFILPADIPAEPWDGFEEMRKRIRKPMTDRSRALAVAELRRLRDEEGWPPGDVLNHCVMNSYQGIFPPTKARRNDIGKSAAAYASLTAGLSPDEPF